MKSRIWLALIVVYIAWGSTYGAALEAVMTAKNKGFRVGALKITSIFPFHADRIGEFMERCRDVVIPELNYEGQLANLIGYLHKKHVVRLNRTTGTPMPPSLILETIEKLI